ncbi:hypothetical protein [Siphonobacter sp. SORGH_AS_0500]|uniref:hypothetical protein n=1 Tax=Siphonobacter sp. SORGH_AS_0500 TaxID=1864824 RepID=UPI00285CD3FE|nr:hypothetical protein [Siphonobacter sp. SORGH_AS_0500]MDR6192976.1 multisubunit Na+/H+ antiporter MnhF subunit [Siphonobacter sp. SORGH_AS_0500]
MGIILIPFLLSTLVIVMYSIIKSFKLIRGNKISKKNIAYSLGSSLASYLIVIISYWYEDQVWVFSPYFRIPILVIIIPFIGWNSLKNNKNQVLSSYSNILILSVALNGIIGILFNNISFGITDFLGIETHH